LGVKGKQNKVKKNSWPSGEPRVGGKQGEKDFPVGSRVKTEGNPRKGEKSLSRNTLAPRRDTREEVPVGET